MGAGGPHASSPLQPRETDRYAGQPLPSSQPLARSSSYFQALLVSERLVHGPQLEIQSPADSLSVVVLGPCMVPSGNGASKLPVRPHDTHVIGRWWSWLRVFRWVDEHLGVAGPAGGAQASGQPPGPPGCSGQPGPGLREQCPGAWWGGRGHVHLQVLLLSTPLTPCLEVGSQVRKRMHGLTYHLSSSHSRCLLLSDTWLACI